MFEIKDSNIEGQGVFASENIKKNCVIGPAYELIGEVNGKYIAGDITILGLMHNHSNMPTEDQRCTTILFTLKQLIV